MFPLNTWDTSNNKKIPKPTFSISFDDADEAIESIQVEYTGKVVKNERLTAASHFQDVRHLEIQLLNDSIK